MGSRKYLKECVVEIDVIDWNKIILDEIIDGIEEIIGIGNMFVVIPRKPGTIEVTVNDKASAEKLSGGLSIGESKFDCKIPYSPYTVVSFMDIPSYIEDSVLIDKLKYFNIVIEGEVIRHYHDRFKTIENGTRHVKCIFHPGLKSLPWAVKLETISGIKSFRVLHNNQTKVCNKCYSESHMIADCPKIVCRKCHQMGHMGNKCSVKLCNICKNLEIECVCSDYFEDDINSTVNELSSENPTLNNSTNTHAVDKSTSLNCSSDHEQKSKKLRLDDETFQMINPISESTRVDDNSTVKNQVENVVTVLVSEQHSCEADTPLPPPPPPLPPSTPPRCVSRKKFHIKAADERLSETETINPPPPTPPPPSPSTIVKPRRNILVKKPNKVLDLNVHFVCPQETYWDADLMGIINRKWEGRVITNNYDSVNPSRGVAILIRKDILNSVTVSSTSLDNEGFLPLGVIVDDFNESECTLDYIAKIARHYSICNSCNTEEYTSKCAPEPICIINGEELKFDKFTSKTLYNILIKNLLLKMYRYELFH
ncbi:hypothetical protein LOTGIDRAFT_172340 [Lottia gigantea]|uniref:CCHC-type domain-containing protein n=1 Tax=Lottia gigantea TaxID=225164 RepID=V4AWM5_LOTGI|nr:hypothetical protein LOTGIDRAFT_172340 [Lottia gigantea]ESP01873.1 hypothetical protein LOTGIDRAFT_172340 [Lottia gigantea]